MTTMFEEEIRSQADILRRREKDGAREALAVASEFQGVDYLLVAARARLTTRQSSFSTSLDRRWGSSWLSPRRHCTNQVERSD